MAETSRPISDKDRLQIERMFTIDEWQRIQNRPYKMLWEMIPEMQDEAKSRDLDIKWRQHILAEIYREKGWPLE